MGKRILSTIAIWLASAVVQAGTIHYEADIHAARWVVSGSPLICALSHDIPLFGQAVFSKAANQKFRLHFKVRQAPLVAGEAKFQAVPAQWQHTYSAKNISDVAYSAGKSEIELNQKAAIFALYQLEMGLRPTLAFSNWTGSHDQVSASMSAVNFREALDEFRVCVSKLLNIDYQDVKQTTLWFDTDKHHLDSENKRKLDDIARYMKADPSVSRVKIDGHTDDIASRRYNDALSKRRAQAVGGYLQDQAIPEQKLKIRFFGEHKPVAPNTNDDNRAKNRRVILDLER